MFGRHHRVSRSKLRDNAKQTPGRAQDLLFSALIKREERGMAQSGSAE